MHYEFEYDKRSGTIELYTGDDTHVISSDNFYDWVLNEGLADYCIDFQSPAESDGHGQIEGTHTKDEYFSLPHNIILDDLKKYYFSKHYRKAK